MTVSEEFMNDVDENAFDRLPLDVAIADLSNALRGRLPAAVHCGEILNDLFGADDVKNAAEDFVKFYAENTGRSFDFAKNALIFYRVVANMSPADREAMITWVEDDPNLIDPCGAGPIDQS